MSIGTPYQLAAVPDCSRGIAARRSRAWSSWRRSATTARTASIPPSAPGLGEKVIGTAVVRQHARHACQRFRSLRTVRWSATTRPTGAPAPPHDRARSTCVAPTPATACPTLVQRRFVSPFTPGSLTGKAAARGPRHLLLLLEGAHRRRTAGAAAVIIANNVAGPLNPTVERRAARCSRPSCPHADFPTCPAIGVPTVRSCSRAARDRSGRRRTGHADLDRPDASTYAERDRRSDLLASARTDCRPTSPSSPTSARPAATSARRIRSSKGSVRQHQRHVDGVAARRGRRRRCCCRRSPTSVAARRPDDPAEQRRSARLWFGNPALGFLDNVHRQGAGMVDIDDAILATTVIRPGKISAGRRRRPGRTRRR